MQNLCRLCALEKTYQIPVFTETGVNIALRIEKLVQVTVTINDVLPKTICTECLALINSYNDFQAKCNQAQFVLKALSGGVLKTEEIEEEQPTLNESYVAKNEVNTETEPFAPLSGIDDSDVNEYFRRFIEIEVLSDGSIVPYEESSDIEGEAAQDEADDEEEDDCIEIEPHRFKEESQTAPSSGNENDNDCETVNFPPETRNNELKETKPTRGTQTRKTRSIFRQLKCCECNAIKRGPKQLQMHFHTTHKRSVVFQCPTCSKRYDKYRSFTRHVILHKEGLQFVCQVCDKSFGQKVQLQNHSIIHTNKSRYQCEECGKKYRYVTSLYKHVRHHSGYKIICEICLQKFTSKDSLRNHKKAFHSAEWKEICKQCGQTFSTRPALYYHLKLHSTNESKEQFACTLCDKDFSTRFLLQQHHRTHKLNIKNEDVSKIVIP